MGAVHARTATPRRQEDLLQSRATGWRLSPAAPMREQETVKQDVLGGAGEDPSPRVTESPQCGLSWVPVFRVRRVAVRSPGVNAGGAASAQGTPAPWAAGPAAPCGATRKPGTGHSRVWGF